MAVIYPFTHTLAMATQKDPLPACKYEIQAKIQEMRATYSTGYFGSIFNLISVFYH